MFKNNFKLVCFILNYLFLCVSCVFSQTYQNNPTPPQTKLISQRKNNSSKVDEVISEYCSYLSLEEILKFYRKIFLSQKMTEHKFKEANTVVFERYPFLGKTIIFATPKKDIKQLCYSLKEQYFKQIPIIPSSGFTTPRKLDFMPTFPKAHQFVYNTFWVPMIGVGYLSWEEPESICDFYIKNAPSFGWKLSDNLSFQGTYNFYNWLKIVDPFTKAIPMLEVRNYEEFIPPLTIRGRTLTFKQDKKSLTITIYKFEDIIKKAKGTIWDASEIEKYGDTLICVFYFPEKN